MKIANRQVAFLNSGWIWIVLALVLRLGFVCRLGNRFHQIDESGYDALAWNLVSLGIIGSGHQPNAVSPLPAVFFALFYKIFGHHLIFPRLGLALVSAATAGMVGKMARAVTSSRRAGRLALALSAVYPFFIYYSGMLMSETLYVALIVPALWWLCKSLQGAGRPLKTAAAAGLAFGLAALCRPEGAPIALLIWIAAAWACQTGRWPWKAWALTVCLWAAPLLLWSARNQVQLGNFILDSHGGITLLHGTIFFEPNEIDTSKAMEAFYQTPLYKEAANQDEAEQNRMFVRAGFAFMRDHPATTLGQWARKFVNFWRFYPRMDKAYHETARSHPGAGLRRGALVAISLAFEPWIILGGLAGLILLLRRSPQTFPLVFFLVGTMGIHMISVSQMRYRLPVMPLLILGVCFLVNCRHSGESRNPANLL